MLPACLLLSLFAAFSLAGAAGSSSSRTLLQRRAPPFELVARQVAASSSASVARSTSVALATASPSSSQPTASITPWTIGDASPSASITSSDVSLSTAAAASSTSSPDTLQSIKDALKPSSPLYPVAIGVCVLFGLIPFLFAIALLKWLAHRVRFSDKKEYCSNIGILPSSSTSTTFTSIVEKTNPSNKLPSNPPQSFRKPGPPSARSSLSSDDSSPFHSRNPSIGSLADTTSWGLWRQPSHPPRSLRPSFHPSFVRPAYSSPATSIHQGHSASPAPSLRHPSLYVDTHFSPNSQADAAPPTPPIPAHFHSPSPRSARPSSPDVSPRSKPRELFPDAEPYVRRGPIARSLRGELVEEGWEQGLEKLR